MPCRRTARHGTALVLPPGQRPLALKRFIQAFGGSPDMRCCSLKAVGPGVKWPVSLVADVHHVRLRKLQLNDQLRRRLPTSDNRRTTKLRGHETTGRQLAPR